MSALGVTSGAGPSVSAMTKALQARGLPIAADPIETLGPTRMLAVRSRTPADYAAFCTWLGAKADIVLQFCEGQNGATTWSQNLAIVEDICRAWQGIDVRHEWAFPGCSTTEPLSETVSGKHDAYIRAIFRTIAMFDRHEQIFVRLPWEANNPRAYPWSWTAAGSSPELYKAAARRIALIARSVSPRFRFGFIVLPSTLALDGTTVVNFEDGYPGDDVVDYIGPDFYYDASTELGTGTHIQRFVGKWNAAYGPAALAKFAADHGKMFAVPEWGINADAPDFVDAMAAMLRQPGLALLYAGYFDVDVNQGQFRCRLSADRYPAASAAFKRAFGPIDILTPALFDAPSGAAFSAKLEANRPVQWSFAGPYGPFSIALGGDQRTVRLIAAVLPAGIQSVTIRATDDRGQSVTKTLTVNFAAAALQPEAQFYLARAAAVPVTGYQAALNRLVSGLKSGGVWDFLDDLFLFQGLDQQLSTASLISLRRAGTFMGTTTYTPKGGARSDGATGYFDTLFQPSIVSHRYQKDDHHFGVWSLTSVPRAGNADATEFGAGGTVSMTRVSNGNIVGRPGTTAAAATLAGAGWPGHTMEVRTGPAAWRSYRKGAPALSGTEASAQQPYETFKALAAQIANGQFGANDIAVVHYGSGLGWTDANAQAFHNSLDLYRADVLAL